MQTELIDIARKAVQEKHARSWAGWAKGLVIPVSKMMKEPDYSSLAASFENRLLAIIAASETMIRHWQKNTLKIKDSCKEAKINPNTFFSEKSDSVTSVSEELAITKY